MWCQLHFSRFFFAPFFIASFVHCIFLCFLEVRVYPQGLTCFAVDSQCILLQDCSALDKRVESEWMCGVGSSGRKSDHAPRCSLLGLLACPCCLTVGPTNRPSHCTLHMPACPSMCWDISEILLQCCVLTNEANGR